MRCGDRRWLELELTVDDDGKAPLPPSPGVQPPLRVQLSQLAEKQKQLAEERKTNEEIKQQLAEEQKQSPEEQKQWTEERKQLEVQQKLIAYRYRITRRIGGGRFGEVYEGVGLNNEKVRQCID